MKIKGTKGDKPLLGASLAFVAFLLGGAAFIGAPLESPDCFAKIARM